MSSKTEPKDAVDELVVHFDDGVDTITIRLESGDDVVIYRKGKDVTITTVPKETH